MIYDRDTLNKAWNAGQTFQFLFFWGHTPAADGSIGPSCLSQWWMQPFTADSVTYSCAEQYMMAEKARMFSDDDMLSEILKAKRPQEMKSFGRAVRNFDPARWNNECYNIVLRGNMEKFRRNTALWTFLKGTKNRILVEASPRDRIWGIGMGKQNLDAENPIKWRGRNLLGFALTEARDRLLEV